MLIATTEVLWWAMSLDERLREDSGTYEGDLAKSSNLNDIAHGLRHARNRLGHQLADAIRVSHGGFVSPVVLRIVFHEMYWVDRTTIDSIPGSRPGPKTGNAYDRALANRLVRLTVRELTDWLLARPELR